MRDPRLDPRPGDVTREMGDIILVVRVAKGIVYYAASGQLRDKLHWMPICNWAKCCKNDEVLHVANES